MTLMPRNKVRTFYSPRHTPVLKRIILLDRRVLIEIESLDKSFILSWVIRLKSDRELVRDEVCPEEQEHCWADKVDSCTEWVRVSVSHTLVITARQAFTQHSDDVIPSQHAPPVPEDTGPAVLCKAPVNTRMRTHARMHLHVQGLVMHVPTNIQTHTHSHSCKYTPKHTQFPTHKHTSSVSWTFGNAVCELPSFQGKAWPFTSILLCACTNCRVVQSIPGRWCLKAHFVSQCVQVILSKLLTRVVRKWECSREGSGRKEFYLTVIYFPEDFHSVWD